MKKLTEQEILRKLQYAGKKRTKQLLIKLIKLYGGKPIQHMLDPSDGETEWYGSMTLECSHRQLLGFSEAHDYNLSTKESVDRYRSLTGAVPEETIIKIVNIIM